MVKDSIQWLEQLCRWSSGVPEVQLEACAVVQPVRRKALLLLTENHSQHAVGTGTHIHSDQPGHLLLPTHTTPIPCLKSLHEYTNKRTDNGAYVVFEG